MNGFVIASLLVACVAGVSATRHHGSHGGCHDSDDCGLDGFQHHGTGFRNPLVHFSDEVLIDELRIRGFACLFRSEHHLPGRPHLGHGHGLVRGRSGKRPGFGRPIIAGGLSHREGSVGNFASLQSGQHGSTHDSTDANRKTILAQNNNQDLDVNRGSQTSLEGTHKHQTINNDKTIVRDLSSATNDVSTLRGTTADKENLHLGSQNSQLVADQANLRNDHASNFGNQQSADFASVAEGSATNVGGVATV